MKLAVHVIEVLVDLSHSLIGLRSLFKHPVEQPIAFEHQQAQLTATRPYVVVTHKFQVVTHDGFYIAFNVQQCFTLPLKRLLGQRLNLLEARIALFQLVNDMVFVFRAFQCCKCGSNTKTTNPLHAKYFQHIDWQTIMNLPNTI